METRSPLYLEMMARRRKQLTAQFAEIFVGVSSFTWELGSGHGHFLTAYAAAHPERRCVGIDLVAERVERADRKRDRARLRNLHFIQAEARLFLEMLPPQVVFSELFVLFPDPWPKARHHKHRIIQPEFLTAAARRASPDCRFYFRTDHGPYFDHAAAVVAEHADWVRVEEPWPFEYETVFQGRAAQFQSLVAARPTRSLA